jgi:hypothetical protein
MVWRTSTRRLYRNGECTSQFSILTCSHDRWACTLHDAIDGVPRCAPACRSGFGFVLLPRCISTCAINSASAHGLRRWFGPSSVSTPSYDRTVLFHKQNLPEEHRLLKLQFWTVANSLSDGLDAFLHLMWLDTCNSLTTNWKHE